MAFEDGYQVPALENDGKVIVTPYPATEGYKTYFTGAGDQLDPLVRGGGPRLRVSWDNIEDRGAKSVEIQFSEPVEIHDGEGYHTGTWDLDDLLDFQLIMPATATTVSGSGNCNRVDSGLGYDVIVPAPGNGGYEADLSLAVPVPADLQNPNGYWDVDHDTGEVTPSATPGQAKFHLFSAEQEVYFVRRVALGHPLGCFTVEPYKAEWIHPRWKLKMIVTKNSAGAGNFAGWLLAFRKQLA